MKLKISEQKATLISSTFTLKEEEQNAFKKCNCKAKEYCRINHHKHSYVRLKSDELFVKLRRFTDMGISSEEIFSAGAKVKCYSCSTCEKTFSKQGHLKRHKKKEHRERGEIEGNVRILPNRGSVIV